MTKRVMAAGHDRKTGRFQTGNSGGGRPTGSRNRLGERFLDDLVQTWDTHGVAALQTCATAEPAQFCKIVAGILPREILISALSANVNIDLSQMAKAEGFFRAFQFAREQIGVEAPTIDLSPEAEAAWTTDYPDDD